MLQNQCPLDLTDHLEIAADPVTPAGERCEVTPPG
jgi:hypothetical protein